MRSTHPTGEPGHSKPRIKSFFGIFTHLAVGFRCSSIPEPRRDSTVNSDHQSKPGPTIPSPAAHNHDLSSRPPDDTTGWHGDVAGQPSQSGTDISEPGSGLRIGTAVAKKKLVTFMSPQPQPQLESIPEAPIRTPCTPPRTGLQIDDLRGDGDEEDHRWWQGSSRFGRAFLSEVFGEGRKRKVGPNRRKGKFSTADISAPMSLTPTQRHTQRSNESGREGGQQGSWGPRGDSQQSSARVWSVDSRQC